MTKLLPAEYAVAGTDKPGTRATSVSPADLELITRRPQKRDRRIGSVWDSLIQQTWETCGDFPASLLSLEPLIHFNKQTSHGGLNCVSVLKLHDLRSPFFPCRGSGGTHFGNADLGRLPTRPELTPASGLVLDSPSAPDPGKPLTWTDIEVVLRVNSKGGKRPDE